MPLRFLSPLHKATRQLTVYLDAQGEEDGVGSTEGHLLSYLRGYGPVPVGELVRVFGIKQSTLTSMLDRLEAAGWLRRDLNPDDRRSFLVQVTDEGAKLTRRGAKVLEALENDIASRVSARSIAGFQAVMAAIDEVTRVKLRER